MNKTKIEYVDYTFNPVTGCLHGCEYCYAKKIANRFGGTIQQACFHDKIHDLNEPMYTENNMGEVTKAPYPFDFSPTFHRYRLDEPQKVKKSSKIFVVSMGDLFGDFVPDEWIEEVFKACEAAPQHTYLFLTKNPKRYFAFNSWEGVWPDNFWIGASASDANRAHCNSDILAFMPAKVKYLSIEPIHEDLAEFVDYGGIDWLIVGAETGNRKDKVIPKREWIENIVEQCKAANVPVFMKNSLIDLMGNDFIQEWPESLQQIAR